MTQSSICDFQDDLILVNGKVVTMDRNNNMAEAVAIKKCKIIKVGRSVEFKALMDSGIRTIDLGGKIVLPGFIDTHVHLDCTAVHTKLAMSCHIPPVKYVGVTGKVTSREEILERIKEKVKLTRKGEWIIGQGRFTLETDGNSPTRAELDKIAPDHPIMIRYSAHTQLLNSKALKLANITRDRPKQAELDRLTPGGKIWRNSKTGEPTGVLTECCDWIFRMRNPWPYEQLRDAIKRTLQEAVRFGITTIHEFTSWPESTMIYQELFRNGELPLRIQLCPTIWGLYKTIDLDCILNFGMKSGFGNEWLKFGSIKIFVDANGLNENGQFVLWDKITPEKLNELVIKAHKSGIRVMMHACNRNGQNMALNAVEAALKEEPKDDHRHRIEHFACRYWRPELDRLKKLAVIPVPTPYSSYGWYGDDWLKTAQPGEKVAIFRTLLDEGFMPPGNSDCMGTVPEALNPWWSIWCAVSRRTENGNLICPEEAITVSEAIHLYTGYSAYAGFEENIKGSIESGKLADLVVLSGDPFTETMENLKSIEVDMTIVDGKIVYSNPQHKYFK